MNDLNSVFIVGRLEGRIIASKNKYSSIFIKNNHYSFDEEKKEYVESSGRFHIILDTKTAKRLSEKIKTGFRIGINGRLTSNKAGQTTIVAHAIQMLDILREESHDQDTGHRA